MRRRVLVVVRPALRTEVAFEALAGLAQDEKTTKAGVPRNPLQAAVIARHFDDEIYFLRPPLAVQRLILRPLAAVGRLLGYRAEYPYPHARDAPSRDPAARTTEGARHPARQEPAHDRPAR